MKANQSAVYDRDTIESLGGNLEPVVSPPRVRYIVILQQRLPKVIRFYFLLFIATIPFEAISLMSDSLSPAKIAGLLFVVSCLLSPKRCFAHPPRALWWLLGYIVVFALQGSVSPLLSRIQLVFLLWVAANLFKEEKLARSALLTYAIAVVILALCTTLQLPGFAGTIQTRELKGGMRVTALGYNPNDLSAVMALAIVILIGLQLEKRSQGLWQKVLFIVSILLPLGVLVSTSSRTGVGALVIGVSLYLLPLGRSRRKMVAIALAVCAIIAIGYMVVSDPVASSRWGETYYQGDVAGRDKIYQATLEMIAERPFLGWGPSECTRELGRRTHAVGGERDAHNLLLHLFMEVGAIGAVPFLVGLWLCTRAAWKGRSGSLGVLPFVLLITVFAINLAHTWLSHKLMWLVLALVLAAASASARGQGRRIVPSNL